MGLPDALQGPLPRTYDLPDFVATFPSNGGTRATTRAGILGQAVRRTPTSLARLPAPPLWLRRGSAAGQEGPQEAGPPRSLRRSWEGWAVILPQGVDPGLLRFDPPTRGRGSLKVNYTLMYSKLYATDGNY